MKRPRSAANVGDAEALLYKRQSTSKLRQPLLLSASLVFQAQRGMEEQPAQLLSPRQVLLTDADLLQIVEVQGHVQGLSIRAC